jgi:hypothetical protein
MMKKLSVLFLVLCIIFPAVPAKANVLTFDLPELDMAYRQPVRPRSQASAHPASNAVNHRPDLWWNALSASTGFVYLIVDLGANGPHTFDTVYMRFNNPSRKSAIHIQTSSFTGDINSIPENTAWTTVWQYGIPNQTELAQFPAATTARYVRFYADLRQNPALGLRFFQVYNTGGCPHFRDAILNPSELLPISQPPRVDAQLVAPRPDGTLQYAPFTINDVDGGTRGGNILPDFSRAGFKGGDVDIPFVNIHTIRLTPAASGDDTARINAAIAEIGNRARVDENGFRGVVEFAPGTYRISGAAGILLNRSGVVLRGSGQGSDGTVLLHTHQPSGGFDLNRSVAITMGTTVVNAVVQSNATAVTDGFYPIGSRTVTVANAANFSVGDRIFINRTATARWNNFMNTTTEGAWGTQQTDASHERVISGIDGNTLHLDIPLVQSLLIPLEATATVTRVNDANRVVNVGVENLRIVPNVQFHLPHVTETHTDTAIRAVGVRDAFVRDVTALYLTYSTVNVDTRAVNVSVINNSHLSPVGWIDGGRRYAFNVNDGRNSLFDGNYAQDARYEFVTGSRIPGPVVFLDGVGENSHLGPETHHRWSTGILFDNVSMIDGGRFEAIDRGSMGGGHGWAGANVTFWNTLSREVLFTRPPTSQNFAVGVRGIIDYYPNPIRRQVSDNPIVVALRAAHGDAYIEAPQSSVNPSSLFRAQSALRRTGDYRNAIPNRPILLRPMPDSGVQQTFTIRGIYERGASDVFIYVNGMRHGNATRNGAPRHEFYYTLTLPSGYHTIAAKQIVGGNESALTAQRTVNVRNANGSHNPTPSSFVYNAQTASSQSMIVPGSLPVPSQGVFFHPTYGADYASWLEHRSQGEARRPIGNALNAGLRATIDNSSSTNPLWRAFAQPPIADTFAAGNNLLLDFGDTPNMPTPNRVTFNKIILRNNGGSSINEFKICVSNDGVNFTNAATRNTTAQGASIVLDFPAPITARFIRYTITDASGNDNRLYSFQVFNTESGVFVHPEYGHDFASWLEFGPYPGAASSAANRPFAHRPGRHAVNSGLRASFAGSTAPLTATPLWLAFVHPQASAANANPNRVTTVVTVPSSDVRFGPVNNMTFAPQQLTLDFSNAQNMPMANHIAFDKIILHNAGGIVINEFTICVSDNGMDFTTVATRNRATDGAAAVQASTPTNGVVVEFENLITTRFLRYTITNANGNGSRLYSLQVYNTGQAESITPFNMDVNGDGVINAADATLLRRLLLEGNGDYTYANLLALRAYLARS